MKSRLLTFAGGLALLALLGHFYAKPLLAQVRAALTQNVDEPGRNPFKVSLLSDASGTASFTVPAGKRYVIEDISGFCSSTTVLDYFVIQPSPDEDVLVPLYRTSVVANSYFTNAFVKTYGEPGSTVTVQTGPFGATGSAGGACLYNLWGYSINLP